MRKVVIDTNVLVSAIHSTKGKPAQVLKLVFLDDETQLFYNQKILDEYSRVLAYKKFDFAIELQKAAIDDIINYGDVLTPTASDIYMPDESDRIFYDTAKTSGAILVTGNKKHYPDEPFILTPAEFLEKYL